MPTTLTGLLLFVVLLLPGFTYVSIRERSAPERRRSPFQETATAAAVSTVTNSISAGVYALLHLAWPATPSLGGFISNGSDYWAERYGSIILAGFGVLAVSVGLAAYGAAAIRNRSPHPSAVSSWWMLFEEMPKKMAPSRRRDGILTTAICYLTDGSAIQGTVFDYNPIADETSDRDLILVAPVKRRPTGAADFSKVSCKAVSLSAREITAIDVDYTVKSPQPPRISALGGLLIWRRRR
jgi:hypothetical protein